MAPLLGARSGDELVSRTLSTRAFLCIFLFRLSSMFVDLAGVARQASLYWPSEWRIRVASFWHSLRTWLWRKTRGGAFLTGSSKICFSERSANYADEPQSLLPSMRLRKCTLVPSWRGELHYYRVSVSVCWSDFDCFWPSAKLFGTNFVRQTLELRSRTTRFLPQIGPGSTMTDPLVFAGIGVREAVVYSLLRSILWPLINFCSFALISDVGSCALLPFSFVGLSVLRAA